MLKSNIMSANFPRDPASSLCHWLISLGFTDKDWAESLSDTESDGEAITN